MAEVTGKSSVVTGFFGVALFLYAIDFIFRAGLGFGQSASAEITYLLAVGYFFLSLWAAYGVFAIRHEETIDTIRSSRNLFLFLCISAVAVLAPTASNLLYKLAPNIATHFFFGMLLVFMSQIWLWYIFITHSDKMGKYFYWLFIIYFVLLIVAAFYATGLASKMSPGDIIKGNGVGQQQLFIDLGSKVWQFLKMITAAFMALFARGRLSLNETMSYATGDYYTGQVDSKATIPNRIDIKELKSTQPTYKDTESVSVFATLTTETIDITPPPIVKLGCSAGTEMSWANARSFDATPVPQQVTLSPYDAWDITCNWKEGTFKLKPPVNRAVINMSAQFDFATQAYLKTYWMDKTRLQELRKNNQDPLTIYNIPDRNPITVYTTGPLKSGMRVSSQAVIGIDKTEQDLTLGVTFDNAWNGNVVRLSNIVLFVPKGIRIVGVVGQTLPPRQINCNDDAIMASDKNACDDAISNIYYIEPQNVDVSKFLTLLFNIKVGPADYERILSSAPITTRYFKSTVRYTYQITRMMDIPIISTQQNVASSGSTETMPAQIVGLPATMPRQNDATITYTTNQLTKDKITYYAPEGGTTFTDVYEDGFASKNETAEHTVHITALTPGTRYDYKIISVNTNGVKAVNQQANYTFTTEAP